VDPGVRESWPWGWGRASTTLKGVLEFSPSPKPVPAKGRARSEAFVLKTKSSRRPSYVGRAAPFVCRVLLACGVLVAGCTGGDAAPNQADPEGPTADPELWDGDVVAATKALRSQAGTERDWEVFRATVSKAWAEGIETLPLGEAIVWFGLEFVGDPYGPGTLEVAGEEDVVVNFEEFDCVTLVENAVSLARFVKSNRPEILATEGQYQKAYRRTLRELRYRGGRVDGYPSRLHYFSDWIRDNEGKGLVVEVTQELGGEEDLSTIDFMTTHIESYRQLANRTNVAAIQQTESELSSLVRYKIPEDKLQDWTSGIQNGDVIAATSTVDGLDVAHTGLAYWQGSELYLLHAPLVGEVVEVSARPLAERLLRIQGQDGIRVVRPVEATGAPGGELPETPIP
jgi:hypothetical protein